MCLEQTMQQHPGTHEPFASKKPQPDVAVHVTLGHVTAGVGAVLPASPWASAPTALCLDHSLALGFSSAGCCPASAPHLVCEALQRIKDCVSSAVGDQERAALLGCS